MLLGRKARHWCVMAVVPALVCAASSGDASAQIAGPLSWGPPLTPGGSSGYGLTDISCPAPSRCVAIDGRNVLTSSNPGDAGSWTVAATSVDFVLNSVYCPTASFCVAGGYQNLLWSTDPGGGPGSWSSDRTSVYGPITCASPALCVSGLGYDVLVSTQPGGGGGTWHETRAVVRSCTDGVFCNNGGISATACPSEMLCLVGTNDGDIYVSTDPAGDQGPWRRVYHDPARVPSGDSTFPATIQDIDCPATSACVAVDDVGNLLTTTDPTGGDATWKRTPVTHFYFGGGVACPSAARCVLADDNLAYSSDEPFGGAPWVSTPVSLTPAPPPRISCPSILMCVISRGGEIVVGRTTHQIQALLQYAMADGARRASVGAVRRRHGFVLSFSAPAAGGVTFRWLARGRRHPVPVATGSSAAPAAGGTLVNLALTRTGQRLIHRSRRLRLTAEGAFTPIGDQPTTTSTTFLLDGR
jgi:hypothetical protein